jgi:hypothetical protein
MKPLRLSADSIPDNLLLSSDQRQRCMKNVPSEHGSVFPEPPPAFDRRRRERINLKIPLRILTYGLLVDKATEASCTDLSEGGVAFDCEAQLNVGDIVIVEFHQKGEAAYRCHARLSYRMGRRYGAYFLAGE